MNPPCVKSWEIIADRLSKAGWSWGCVATINPKGQIIFVAAAHRDDGRRFIVRADEKLTEFMKLKAATGCAVVNTLLAKNYNVEAAPHH